MEGGREREGEGEIGRDEHTGEGKRGDGRMDEVRHLNPPVTKWT